MASVAIDRFNKLISILDGTRTGHAQFRRAPIEDISIKNDDEVPNDSGSRMVYCAKPLQCRPPIPTNRRSTLRKCLLKRKYSLQDDHHSATDCKRRCQCLKRSRGKLKMGRWVRSPAVSMNRMEIPPDDLSWRKYGQKPIKGSPHPRGYYKCSTVRGCPARKHVERAADDPTMMIVTYESEHNHLITSAVKSEDGLPKLLFLVAP